MGARTYFLCLTLSVGGCTHASVSNIPMQTTEGDVYRYQGRANFAHQIEEGDRVMSEKCRSVNGGRPVLVDLKKTYLGQVDLANGSATTTGSVVATGNVAIGATNTVASASSTSMANYNQEILFKCVK